MHRGSIGFGIALAAAGIALGCGPGEIGPTKPYRTSDGGAGDESPSGAAGGAGASTSPAVSTQPPACSEGQTECESGCTKTDSDDFNCGQCGKSCATGTSCQKGSCVASVEGCPSGQSRCGTSCVDRKTSAEHCGACDRACTDGQQCVAGECSCASGTVCGGKCVDTSTSAAHCGRCDNACPQGQTCSAGQCTCPKDRCDDVCVDMKTDSKNCGKCGLACKTNQTCEAGACACQSGRDLCDETCVDKKTDAAHCGECGHKCPGSQECNDGACGGPLGGDADNCNAGLAKNLTISKIAINQATEIMVMSDGSAVAPSERNVDVVAGRDAAVRVLVTVETSWTARELSARVILINDADTNVYSQKKAIKASSTIDKADNSFVIASIPKEKITPTTKYIVEVAECVSDVAGTVKKPQYPTDGAGADLEAKKGSGGLKITIVPLTGNEYSPDTTDAQLQVYRDMFLAMYPIDGITLNVATAIDLGNVDFSSGDTWSATLDRVANKRATDKPGSDVYYYGMLAPAKDFRTFCQAGCITGLGALVTDAKWASQRVAIGIGFSGATSAETMAHEVGHNHGRPHVIGCAAESPDADFPSEYIGDMVSGSGRTQTKVGRIGKFGWDRRKPTQYLDAVKYADIMNYCEPQWISDYTYKGLMTRVAAVNGAKREVELAAADQPWRVLLAGASSVRWGLPLPEPVPPAGTPEIAQILDDTGTVMQEVEVFRTELSDGISARVLVPVPEPGWFAIRVRGEPELTF